MLALPAPVQTALSVLQNAGFSAYVVGGCVRDALRGETPDDYDVTTDALPEQVETVFRADRPAQAGNADRLGVRIVETGLKHGTVTVLLDGMPLEITTFRTESGYSDHRRPDRVDFTRSLREDLARRDFTVNAMAWSPVEGLIDPFGGENDLAAGLLRCVGDPRERFNEDALRILRLLRFAAKLRFRVEAETAAAARALAPTLSFVSPERIRKELTRLLCAPDAARILLDFPGILTVPLPELAPCVGFDQRNPHHDLDVWAHSVKTLAAVPAEPVLRWAALLHDVGKPSCYTEDAAGIGHFYGHAKQSAALADALLTRLRFDNASRETIVTLVAEHDLQIEQTPRAVRRALSRLGVPLFRQLLALKRADNSAHCGDVRARIAHADRLEAIADALLAEEGRFTLRDLAVDGRDLLALGYEGPAIGKALQALLDAVLDERVPNEKEALLAYLS